MFLKQLDNEKNIDEMKIDMIKSNLTIGYELVHDGIFGSGWKYVTSALKKEDSKINICIDIERRREYSKH